MYPMISYTLAKIHESEQMSPKKSVEDLSKVGHEISFKKLFLLPRFTFGAISQILVYCSVTFIQPTLALHLEQFGYTPVFIGFSFAIPTLLYAATSPLIFLMTSRMRKSGVIFIGYCILSAAFFLIGPSKLMGLYNSPSFIILGLGVLGFGIGMIIIPVLPDMIEQVEEKHPELEELELHNKISGIFICS
jgi:MFS family permease